MIKMFCALPRRPDVAPQAFHDHWRHPHGSWGLKIDTVRGYVQSHRIACPLLGDGQSRYDGVVEVWFDGVADAASMPDHPVYRRYLVPDEPNFIDMTGIRFLFTAQEMVAGPSASALATNAGADWDEAGRPTSIKLIQLIEAEGDQPWRQRHDAELGWRIGALRHVCSTPSLEVHPDPPAFIAVRELWWPTLTAFEQGVAADPAAFTDLVTRARSGTTLLASAERMLGAGAR